MQIKLKDAIPYLLPAALIIFSYVFFGFNDGTLASAADGSAPWDTNMKAMDAKQIFNFGGTFVPDGTDAKEGLPMKLKAITESFFHISAGIVAIMTVVAGGMVVFGLEDGKKTIWTYMLSIGLAIEFAGFILDLFGGEVKDPLSQAEQFNPSDFKITGTANDDIFTYVGNIFQQVRDHGTEYLVPIAIRMAIIFAVIDGSIKVALDLISGDKVKFMIQTILKLGFYIFLIKEWSSLASAVCTFFETIGYRAAGLTADQAQANNIWQNGVHLWDIVMNAGVGGRHDTGSGPLSTLSRAYRIASSPITALFSGFITIVAVLSIFYVAVEMFIARIEFYLMSMIAVIMLPFGLLDQMAFLAKQTISGVFNCAVKVMTIAFIGCINTTVLTALMDKMDEKAQAGKSLLGNFPYLLEILLVCCLMAYITKSIPQLVQTFLSGQSGLSGGGMINQVKQVASGAAKVGAAVATGGATAAGLGFGVATAKAGGMTMSQIGKSALANKVANSSMGKAFANAATTMAGSNVAIRGGGGFLSGVNRAMGSNGQSLSELLSPKQSEDEQKKKGGRATEKDYAQDQKNSAPTAATLAAMSKDKDSGKTYQPPINTTNNYNTQNTKNDNKNIMGGNGDGKGGTINAQTMPNMSSGASASSASTKAPDTSSSFSKDTKGLGTYQPASTGSASGSSQSIKSNPATMSFGSTSGSTLVPPAAPTANVQGITAPSTSPAPSGTPTLNQTLQSTGSSGGGASSGGTASSPSPSPAPASPAPSSAPMPESSPSQSSAYKKLK